MSSATDPSDSARATSGATGIPGADRAHDFAAQAERTRRAGDPNAALERLRTGLEDEPHHVAGRVALALALLDLGRSQEARHELEAIVHVGEAPREDAPLSELDDAEVERAFDEASPEADAMLDAERIAFGAVRAVEDEGPGSGPELPGAAFRTQTMAHLLERQGDRAGAEAIRASLRSEIVREDSPARADRRIEVLERWLARLRRG